MPAVVALPMFWGAVAAVAGGGAAVVGAKISSNATKDAAKTQVASADKTLAFEQATDAKDRAQYQAEYDRTTGLQDAELARKAALASQVAAGRNTLAGLAPSSGPAAGPAPAPRPPMPPMPTGWKPGDPIPTTPAPVTAAAAVQSPIPRTLADLVSPSAPRAGAPTAPVSTPTAPVAAPQPPPMPPPQGYQPPAGMRMPPTYAPYANTYQRPGGAAPTLADLRGY